MTLRLHGAHNVPDALAAAALARELGLDLGGIADGLSAAAARSRWRMEVNRRPDGVTVINDAYNANPDPPGPPWKHSATWRGTGARSPSSVTWPSWARPAPATRASARGPPEPGRPDRGR